MSARPDDMGFADLDAVRAIVRASETQRAELLPEYERRRALIIRRQAELLIELIDQRIELQRVLKRPFGAGLIREFRRYFFDLVECVWPSAAKHFQHRDLEIAQESDLALQLAEAVFLHSFVDVSVHGFGFPEIPFEEMAERIPASIQTHRLCGDDK